MKGMRPVTWVRRMATQTVKDVDVAIVGGGIVGTALAASLGSSPLGRSLKVALVDSNALSGQVQALPGHFTNRVSSLTPQSVAFLKGIDVWNRIDASRTHPYHHMRVWDAVGGGSTHFESHPSPYIAVMLENAHLQAALVSRVAELANVQVLDKTTVSGITRENGFPIVSLSNGSSLHSQVLIGADGFNSRVRAFAGIQTYGWAYDQKAIVCTMNIDDSLPNDTAWQRFLPTGPIAMLPLANGYSSLVWSTRPHIADKLLKLSASNFVHLLNAAFQNPSVDVTFLCDHIGADGAPTVDIATEAAWGRQRAAENVKAAPVQNDPLSLLASLVSGPAGVSSGPRQDLVLPPTVLDIQDKTRAAFPLKMANCEEYIGDKIALIGDAAHSVHPLAGQGLNLGLRDAQALSQTLQNAVRNGQDLGAPWILESYASQRYLPNAAMLAACDSIYRLFGTDWMPVSLIRSLGLNVTDRLGPLKEQFKTFAGQL